MAGSLTIPTASETAARLAGDAALDGRLSTVESDNVTGLPSKAQVLTPTAVKTSAYTAAVSDYVPVDTTLGVVTITLPSAPADKTRIGVKHIIQGSTNAVTIARGGSDVFNKAGGSTSLTLPLLNQGFLLQYKASTGIWYAQSSDTPLSGLDGRFVSLATGTATAPQPITGVFRWGPATGPGQLRVRDPADDGRSLFDLESGATSGNIFHLTTGSGATQNANLMAMGVDDGSQGLYVHCRGDRPVTGQGFGLKVIVERLHGGIPVFVGAGLGAKPGIWLQQAYDTVTPSYQTGMVEFAYSALDASQKLHEWRSPGSGLTQYTGTLGGFVRATDAALVWLSTASFQPSAVDVVPVTMLGLSGQTANLLRFYVAGGPGDVGFVAADGTFSGKAFVATAAGGYLEFNDTNQTANSRRFRVDNSGGTWRLTARNDDLTNKAVLLTVSQAGALAVTSTVTATVVQAQAAGAYLDFYDTGGTADQRRWRFKQSSGSLLLCKTTDAGTPTSVLGIAQTGTLTPLDGANIVLGTTTGMKIGTGATQKLAFYNATPIAQPGAFVQTYATATRTNATPTAASVATTAAALASYGFTQAQADALVVAVNALVVDVANNKQVLNALIDDHQALGLAT